MPCSAEIVYASVMFLAPGVLLDITSFVVRVTTLILGVSYKDITTLILEVPYNDIIPTFNLGVSYNDDYSWGMPCWLVALLAA